MNDGNIDTYLGDLEEYSNQILLYKSKLNQPGMFFTSTTLIEEVPYKDFKSKNTVSMHHYHFSLPYKVYNLMMWLKLRSYSIQPS